MIGRFQAMLPFTLHRVVDAGMGAWTTTADGYEVTVHPPQQALVSPEDLSGMSVVPLLEAMRQVRPNPSPKTAAGVELDAKSVVPLNLLVIDFKKDELKRSGEDFEPSFDLVFEFANDVLARMRSVLRVASIRPLRLATTAARIDYLNDDGSPVDADGVTPRSHVLGASSFSVAVLRSEAWADASALAPDFEPRPWDEMLMDASDVLPRIEAAIVLAFAALESFIDWALEEFAAAGAVDPALYRWIAERDNIEKRPSPKDRYDVLLKALGGKSLKDEPDLWTLFSDLYRVRNKSAHEGHATLNGVRVNLDKARELVGGAERIIAWAEQLLPEEMRRPATGPTMELVFTKLLTGADPATQQAADT